VSYCACGGSGGRWVFSNQTPRMIAQAQASKMAKNHARYHIFGYLFRWCGALLALPRV
jgi:hypothetical protein